MNPSVPDDSALNQYTQTLRRGLPIIVLVTALMTCAAVFLSSRQQALYEASADVFVDTKNVGSSLADVGQSGVEPARVLDTQAKVARVPDIVRPTIARVSPPLDAETFLERSSVTADPNADVLTFSVTHPDQRVAVQLASAYAREYTKYRRKLDTGALETAQAQVDGQLTRLRASGRAGSTLYAELTSRSQALRERSVLLASVAQLGRPAQDAEQVQPHPVRNGILGFIFGLLVGGGLAFVREALNTRVRSANDVEQQLDLPLLGRLYEPGKSLRSRDELAMMVTPDAPEMEAFQLLATNIEFTNLDRGAKSLMITSANPSEGKSTSIANLAVTFARSGKQVVLVDLDLRRPVLHRFFDLETRPGITEVALGRAWLDDALVEVPLTGATDPVNDGELGGKLEVLPAGPLPPNAAEFLRSQALGDVLRRLEERADLVLVDAPAMLAVSDAINLTPKVDAVIILTRVPLLRRTALDELRRLLDNAPVDKLGFIVTGASPEDGHMGSYGYGYGYGYGYEGDASRKAPSLT